MKVTVVDENDMPTFSKRQVARVARASTLAIKEAAEEVKRGARQAIGAGGFSKRWQNAFRVNVYPASGTSMDPALYGFSKIDYANIFQTGGTIRGKRGLMWVPLPSAPKRIGGKRTTVRAYLQSVGPLQYLRRAGRPPVLVASVLRQVRGGKQVTMSRLKRGAAAARSGRPTKIVPIFLGLSAVTQRRRFNVTPAYHAAAAKIPAAFDRHMGEE